MTLGTKKIFLPIYLYGEACVQARLKGVFTHNNKMVLRNIALCCMTTVGLFLIGVPSCRATSADTISLFV
jgi:hypothetical protein